MKNAKRMGRLGLLAVSLAIGAAVAATPGTASADPLPPPFDPNNFAISIDGMTLFQTGTATATSGMGDIAIADGANSTAQSGIAAFPGQLDTAVAYGAGSSAIVGDGNFDSGFATGTGSLADVGGFSPTDFSNGDLGFAFGANTIAESGSFTNTVPSANDVAVVFDPFGNTGSEAEAGNGNFDFASIIGDHSFAGAGFIGNIDLAEVFGNSLDSTTATGGSLLSDILSGVPF